MLVTTCWRSQGKYTSLFLRLYRLTTMWQSSCSHARGVQPQGNQHRSAEVIQRIPKTSGITGVGIFLVGAVFV